MLTNLLGFQTRSIVAPLTVRVKGKVWEDTSDMTETLSKANSLTEKSTATRESFVRLATPMNSSITALLSLRRSLTSKVTLSEKKC